MIKIMFFLPSLTGGGAERTLVNIANGLDRKKYAVHFLIIDRPADGKYKDEYFYLLKDDIMVHNLKISICKRNYLKIILKMRAVIRKENPQIVMSTMLRPNIMLVSALMISGYKGKVILRESNNRTATNVKKLERIAIRFIYGMYADRTVALSRGVKYDLYHNFKVAKKKISVIYNPIDIESINNQKNDPVDIEGENIIVAAGRLTQQKNYPGLIDALVLLKERSDFKLYILGKGELESQIKSYIKSVGLNDNIVMEGFQSNPYSYIAKADVFVLSSDWEGFGHVVVEAMACGTAVVSTDCPYGPGEIITDHKNGILVPVHDPKKLSEAIYEVLENKELRTLLEKNGLERARDFSRDKIVKQYEKLFEKVLKYEM